MGKVSRMLGAAVLTGVLIAGCTNGKDSGTVGNKGKATETTQKTETKGWETFGFNYGNTRHVPYNQITKDNIKDLGLVWSADFKELDKEIPGGNQGFPLVVNDVLYTTTSYNHIFAFEAATGKLLWHWKPDSIGSFKNFGLNVNRGVAYGDGKVYMLTLDNKIVSVNAKTGKTVKIVKISDAIPEVTAENGYYETTAPIFYKGKLLIGCSGADNGVRGFVMAYNADLTPAWDEPFWNVPPRGTGWMKNKFSGGGTVWMPVTIDEETGIMYYSVANPAPDFYGEDRQGDNKWTDSVVALDTNTGKMVWARQQVSHDLWDYDTAASPLLYKATVGGKIRKVVSVGTKGGEWFAYDAKTGKPIYENVSFAKISHPNPTPKGTLVYPGALGGQNYAPSTYDPATNILLIPGIEQPMIIYAAKNQKDNVKNGGPGTSDFGTTMAAATNIKPYGTVTAIDLNTGKKLYQNKVSEPMRGGFTSNANSIAFYGGGDGYLVAMDIKTGKTLWKFQTGAPIAAAPTIFEKGGKDYIAISVGGTSTSSGGGKESKIMVFALGGNKTQMKAAAASDNGAGHGSKKASLPKEGTWITNDAANKKAELLLISGYNGVLSGMNFNGYGNGDMTFTVPLNWEIKVDLQNKSGQMPHSVMVVPENTKGKVKDFKLAFKGAQTPDPLAGFIGSKTQSFTFKADKEGTYLLWCAVPGHGSMGMYVTLVVDGKAKETTVTHK
ncbi:outer membrane protein assembly factor BamB family protein [Heyndrickxia coagulans]|uniref:PQQ-binding-like beta-propeller repeat protein n=1 Tax=Heyndrickxia coagulans TaxID=1398 RepID=A0AAW7CL14_HEYCO|nr:PQQ-binding-like beta-propeller repeat protein [Heyndrickxia coagulans]MDL5042030.1 PQQ-binding-like beta-propeller repeat protein [Heyndrickxia coagulans]